VENSLRPGFANLGNERRAPVYPTALGRIIGGASTAKQFRQRGIALSVWLPACAEAPFLSSLDLNQVNLKRFWR